ncbi:MAG: hypothetical protein J1E42_06610 [Akkermansiaceae bacterium]|nr:hypothetical protein [Akkermansiaceae bacterium]
MAVYHQHLTVARPAGEDFAPEAEGCFVTLGDTGVQLAAADTAPEAVYGVLTDVAEELGKSCTVATPGFSGTVGVRLAADAKDGDQLALTEGGAVKPAENGATVVAVALANGVIGKLVEARLAQPYAAAAGAAALAAAAPVAVAAAPVAAATTTASKKTSTK